MSYVGKTDCFQCNREVDVSINRAGMAYYRCAPCGVHVQEKTERGNRMLLGKTRRFADPDEAPEPVKTVDQEARESREITEAKPAHAAPVKPAKRGGLGFFSGG